MFCLIILISVLIGVSFLTLLEQKRLRYIQLRKGPNKVRIFGILQPFSDAIKLFTKEYIIPKFSNYYIYLISPIFSLLMSLIVWFCFPFIIKFISFNLSILYLLRCLRLSVYSVILSG
jgi:NADH-ubiquinone oxidoreductase chain 1